MKKTVLTFGLISGLIISILMGGSLLVADRIGSAHSMALGYTIMVASFLLIYFGIRSYRDHTLHGRISFGRAFACGFLITLITTACYVVMWEVLYFNFMPHFMDGYFAAQVQRVRSAGLDSATTAAQVAAILRSQQLYQNPLINAAYTVMEPLPVGLLITLISAALLRRNATTPTRSSAERASTRRDRRRHLDREASNVPERPESVKVCGEFCSQSSRTRCSIFWKRNAPWSPRFDRARRNDRDYRSDGTGDIVVDPEEVRSPLETGRMRRSTYRRRPVTQRRAEWRDLEGRPRVVDGLAIGLVIGLLGFAPIRAALVAAVLLAVRLVARRKPGRTSGWGLFGFTLILATVLIFAVDLFASASRVAIWMVSLANAQALWVEHRFTDYAPPPLALSARVRERIVKGIWFGAVAGLILMAIAAIPLGLAEASGEGIGEHAAALLLVSYPLVGIAVGAMAGATLRLALHPAGLLLLGALGGALVYAAFGVLDGVIEGTGESALEILAIGCACGLLVGPSVAFAWLTREGSVPMSLFP